MGFNFGSLPQPKLSSFIPSGLPSSVSDLFGSSNGYGGSQSKSYSLCCGMRQDQYGNSGLGFDTSGFFDMYGQSLDDLLGRTKNMDQGALTMWTSQADSAKDRLAKMRQLTPLYLQMYQVLMAGMPTPSTQKAACNTVASLASQGQSITGSPQSGLSLDNFEMYEHSRNMAIIKDTATDISADSLDFMVSGCYVLLRNYVQVLVTKNSLLSTAMSFIKDGIDTIVNFVKPIISKVTGFINGAVKSVMGMANNFFSSIGDRLGIRDINNSINGFVEDAYDTVSTFSKNAKAFGDKVNSVVGGLINDVTSIVGRVGSLANCSTPF